jgi:ketosteroid isomerase-like protein
MSPANIELHRRAHDAFNQRDLDAFLALADPDIEIAPQTVQLEGVASFQGHDGVRRWWTDLLAVFPDFHTEIDEVRERGDLTIVRARLRGHGVESDAFFERHIWQVVKWRDSKALWWGTFLNEGDAEDAASLRD